MPYVPRFSDDEESKSILGFLGNLVQDVPEVAEGFGTVLGTVWGDVKGGAADLGHFVTGDREWEPDYRTDELAKALVFDPELAGKEGFWGGVAPALREDYKRRYGGEGFETVKDELYENPLSYLTDVLGVATAGGAVAGKAGIAGKAGTFRYVDDAARVREVATSANPVRRLAQNAVMRSVTRPLKELDNDPVTAKLTAAFRDADPSIVDDIRAGRVAQARKKVAGQEHLERFLELADSDVNRVIRDIPGKQMIKREMNRILGHNQTAFLRRATKYEGQAHGILKRLGKKELPEFAHTLQAVRGKRAISAGTLPYEEIAGTLLRSASTPDDSLGRRLIERYGRAAADPDGTRVLLASANDAPRVASEVAETLGGQVVEATPNLVRVNLPTGQVHTVRLQTEPTKRIVDLIEDDAQRIPELEQQGLADEVEAAQAVIEDLAEPILDELQGNPLDPVSRAVADYRVLSHEAITQPLLRRGDLKYTTHMDHTYMGRRLEDMAASSSKEARAKRLEDTRGEWRNFRRADIERGVQRPVHFSHMDERRAGYADFMMTKGQRAMARSKPSSLKESTGLQFLQETYKTDVRDVFSRQARQIARYEQTQEQVDEVVRRYGRRITRQDEIAPSEAVYNPHAAKIMFETRKDIEAAFTRHFDKNPDAEFDELIGKAVKDTLPDTEERILETLRVAKERGLPVYAVPKAVANQLENSAKGTLGWKTRLFWDGPTNTWRTLVLAASPRWVVNNILGNITFTGLQAGAKPLVDVAHMAFSKKFRREVKSLVPEEVSGGLFGTSEQYTPHLGRAGETKPGKVVLGYKKSKVGKGLASIPNFTRRLNAAIEDAFREASYLSAMDRQAIRANIRRTGSSFLRSKRRLDAIAEAGADPQKVQAGINEVNKFLNDYNALSPFERRVTRRFLMPFWGFYKHTIKLMARLPIENPGRFLVLDRVTQVSKEMRDEELGPMPEFLRTAVPLGEGAEPGETEFMSTAGMNPFSGLMRGPLEGTLSGAHPVVQSLIEEYVGIDAFTHNPITSPNIVPGGFGSDQMYKVDPETGRAVPVEGGQGRGLFEQLVRSVPQAELARDVWEEVAGEGAGARYGTGQVIRDPLTGEPKYPADMGQDVASLFGAGTFDYNLGEWQQRTAEEQRAALEEIMRRVGSP